MIRRFISTTAALTMIFTSSAAVFSADAAGFSISVNDLDLDDHLRSERTPDPDSIPINDSIKDLTYNDIKIMIDPGHFSYYNQSPVFSPYWESVMTWKLSNYLKQELEALGAHADLTKSSLDEDPDLNDRGFLSKGYDLFLSVHSNAEFGTYSDAPMAFVYQDLPWTTIDDVSADVGKLLADTTAEVMGTNQKGSVQRRKGTEDHDKNGVMDDEWYSVLFGSRYVGTPGILMEHSFHTNYRSAVWLYNDDNLKKLAKAEAKVIYDYFDNKKKSETPPNKFAERIDGLFYTLKGEPLDEKNANRIKDDDKDNADNSDDKTDDPENPAVSKEELQLMNPASDFFNCGDIDGDGKISPADAAMVLREYTLISSEKQGELTDIQLKAADIDGDGIITGNDATVILRTATDLSANT